MATPHSYGHLCLWLGILAVFCVVPIACHFIPTQLQRQEDVHPTDDADFNWTAIQPARTLEYHDCYDALQCARLLLPLDWTHLELDEEVALAIINLPAAVEVTDASFGGTIIVNPGGPSGSGVGFLRSSGRLLQDAVRGERDYDILSFDPRGVFHSTPHPDCFEDSLARQAFNLRRHALGTLDTSNETVKMLFASSKGYGQLCAAHSQAKFDIMEYMSTASVARDILEIVNSIEDLYESRRQQDLGHESVGRQEDRRGTTIRGNQHALIPPKGSMKTYSSKLQYWGFSYGTFLGNTFASMFPDRVGRMVLDGVVDALDYSRTRWSRNLQDTELVMQSFYQSCFDAGPSCPLYDVHGPESIKDLVEASLAQLYLDPIPVGSDIITYSILKELFFKALYTPLKSFPEMASMIVGMQQGNYTEILSYMHSNEQLECPLSNATETVSASPYSPEGYDFGDDVQTAILCGDGDDVTDSTLADFVDYLDMLELQSPWVGSIWAGIHLGCIGWAKHPKWRFAGPFEGNTSHPILWIGNRADPVTPIENAFNMARSFPGSAVLTHNSSGHCSVLSAPSTCTTEHLKRYFGEGVLPDEGTVCPVDCQPFQEGCDKYRKD